MSFLITLLITAALFALSEILRPKPNIEDARPPGAGDFRFPTAEEDRLNPIVWGTVMLSAPNVVWWRLIRQEPITETVKTGLFSKESIVKGYRFYVSMQLALCRGEISSIRRILIAEKEVFNGDTTSTISIDAPNLFGGDELGGGGVIGDVDVEVGSTGQTPNAYLEPFQTIAAATTPAAPAYIGSAYLVAKEVFVGTSTQIAPWKIEATRIPNGLGLSAGEAELNGGLDANPANVAYEVITNAEWGLGRPVAAIDTSNFSAAAATLATEDNGFSMHLERELDAEDMLDELNRHISGVIRVNRTTGKWEIKLARADYDINSVPQILDDDVIEVKQYTGSDWFETTNEVRLVFADRSNNYKATPAFAHDQANIEIQGRVVVGRVEYPGVKNTDQAADFASRELRTLSYPLRSATLVVDRKFYAVNRGDVLAWTDTARGLTQLAMRVTEVGYGTIQEGAITLELVEDVFRFEAPTFGAPDPTLWTPGTDDLDPIPSDEQIAFEAPRKFLVLDDGPLLDKVWCGARTQGLAATMKIHERHAASSPSGSFVLAGEAWGFLKIGELKNNLDAGSAIPLTSLLLTATPDTQALLVAAFGTPTVEDLGTFLAHLCLVGSEFFVAETAEANASDVQLNNVYRGVLDSAQADHTAGDTVWLLFVAGNLTDSFFPPTDEVHVKLLPRSRTDEVAIGDATQIVVQMANRIRRPYPPGRILLNGSAYPDPVSLEGEGSDGDDYGILIGWIRRDGIRTVDEVEALTTDASSLFGDFPTFHDTKYDVEIRANPSTSNTLVKLIEDVQPDQTVLRNEILAVTAGVVPTDVRFTITAKHTFEGVDYTSIQDLVFDPAPSSALSSLFNFGAPLGFVTSNLYTATVAGTYSFTLVSALPSGTALVEYRLNGGAWTTLIAGGATSGNIAGVIISDTIEIRHTETNSNIFRFLSMDAPGAGQDGYAVLRTGDFSPDDLPELSSWHDFPDAATLNLSGSTINGIDDKSANGRDLSQSGTARPTLVTVGGMDMAQFDGVNDSLRVGTNAVHEFGTGDFLIAIVYRSADATRGTLINKGTTDKYFCRVNDTDSSPVGKLRFDMNDGSTTETVLDSGEDYADDVVRIITLQRDGNNQRVYADGVEVAASPNDITGLGDIDSADDLEIGIRLTSQQPLDGEIGELIIYKGSLTSGEITSLHDYLKAKWGIS